MSGAACGKSEKRGYSKDAENRLHTIKIVPRLESGCRRRRRAIHRGPKAFTRSLDMARKREGVPRGLSVPEDSFGTRRVGRRHPAEQKVPVTKPIEHLQLFRPWQIAKPPTFGILGLQDLLEGWAHGCKKRFSNFAQASSRECRKRMFRRRSSSATPASTNMTSRA